MSYGVSFIANPTQLHPGSNPGHVGGKIATICLSYGTAVSISKSYSSRQIFSAAILSVNISIFVTQGSLCVMELLNMLARYAAVCTNNYGRVFIQNPTRNYECIALFSLAWNLCSFRYDCSCCFHAPPDPSHFNKLFLLDVHQLLVTANALPSSLILFILMMVAMHSSEMSVLIRTTRRHTPGDGILHSRRRENLKSYIAF
jgi:hypothetical protein